MSVQSSAKTAVERYGFSARLARTSVEVAKERIGEALKEEGFGILTEIDVRATLQKKLREDFRPYLILGACNPTLAHRALSLDLDVGLLLPCNVCVWQEGDDAVVSIVDPQAMFSVVKNPALLPIVDEASARLRSALNRLVQVESSKES